MERARGGGGRSKAVGLSTSITQTRTNAQPAGSGARPELEAPGLASSFPGTVLIIFNGIYEMKMKKNVKGHVPEQRRFFFPHVIVIRNNLI